MCGGIQGISHKQLSYVGSVEAKTGLTVWSSAKTGWICIGQRGSSCGKSHRSYCLHKSNVVKIYENISFKGNNIFSYEDRENKKIYRDGDVCIKVFNEDFSKIDVLNEALNQARIETTGLKVPKIKEVTMIDGQWAIVSEYIEGKTLASLIEEHPEKLDEYLEFFVSYL